jgi:hypothetical protein
LITGCDRSRMPLAVQALQNLVDAAEQAHVFVDAD